MKKILLITICLMSMTLTNAQNFKIDKKSLKKDLKKVEKELKTLDEESIHYNYHYNRDFELRLLKEKKLRDETDKLLEDVEKLEKNYEELKNKLENPKNMPNFAESK